MATSIVRPVANRAVHLRIHPRPSNIAESREMMRLVAQFGEIEHFKNFKYDPLPAPNSAVVIFKDEEAAQYCLKKSPIRFRLEQEQPFGDDALHDKEPRQYQIQARSARIHFRDQLNASRFHGAYAIDTKSAAQQDLAKRVPLIGLSDLGWDKEGKPWRVMEKEKDRESTGATRRKGLQEIWQMGEANAGKRQIPQG
ncbi:Hypothetical protein R9X50_00789800 [Acrodontium crateriforme]|uniref:Uncharacterized protein n=1 Tax=Acrodontium crateriforme TaxID=150365 RepID=A0AAQ3MC21_9PEZI|nr:Hypothetical protein R9X50_00789800 [Acrodontium crateriforme]